MKGIRSWTPNVSLLHWTQTVWILFSKGAHEDFSLIFFPNFNVPEDLLTQAQLSTFACGWKQLIQMVYIVLMTASPNGVHSMYSDLCFRLELCLL